jgi:hypothetical protein
VSEIIEEFRERLLAHGGVGMVPTRVATAMKTAGLTKNVVHYRGRGGKGFTPHSFVRLNGKGKEAR